MFARFCTLCLIVLSAVLLFSVDADAIEVDYVGPESSYDDYITTGATQYSRADFDEPFHTVHWYVKKEGQNGYGTEEDVDYGDGIRTSSQFRHTFDTGSTSGEAYVITAYVYPAAGIVDEDSYTLTVWTPFEDVVTVSKNVTDEMRVGDSYACSFTATSSASNYVVEEIKVYVDDVLIASQAYSDVTEGIIYVSGSLTPDVGAYVPVVVKVFGKIIDIIGSGSSKIVKTITKGTLGKLWNVILRGTIHGECLCAGDKLPGRNALDNEVGVDYVCRNLNGQIVNAGAHDNQTTVTWDAGVPHGNALNGGPYETNLRGFYTTKRTVPLGYNIALDMNSKDLHLHGPRKFQRICKYDETEWIRRFGNVKWKVGIPIEWEPPKRIDFIVEPISVKDPCANN